MWHCHLNELIPTENKVNFPRLSLRSILYSCTVPHKRSPHNGGAVSIESRLDMDFALVHINFIILATAAAAAALTVNPLPNHAERAESMESEVKNINENQLFVRQLAVCQNPGRKILLALYFGIVPTNRNTYLFADFPYKTASQRAWHPLQRDSFL